MILNYVSLFNNFIKQTQNNLSRILRLLKKTITFLVFDLQLERILEFLSFVRLCINRVLTEEWIDVLIICRKVPEIEGICKFKYLDVTDMYELKYIKLRFSSFDSLYCVE